MRNFFISYNKADRAWAEWLAWELEEAGYTTVLQAWDFRPSENFVLKMNQAIRESERTVAVLSPSYLRALFTQPEWSAAFAQDPTNEKGILVPVRVRECELAGLFKQIIYIDLVGKEEEEARRTLLGGIQGGRVKPPIKPDYPGIIPRSVPEQPKFPGQHSTIGSKQALHPFSIKNLVGVLGLVFSVVAIVISVYFHNPVAERVPTLLVDPVRTTIVNSKAFPNSSLKVMRDDNVLIKGDVTALRVYFWNAGKQSIKPENVLQPVTISLNDASGEILDYRILKVSRPDVVQINLTPNDKSPTKELLLGFNILEEDDGFTCQIIYSGNPSAELTASGVIEGVRRVSSNETVSSGRFWSELLTLLPIYLSVFVMLSLLIYLGFRVVASRGPIVRKIDKTESKLIAMEAKGSEIAKPWKPLVRRVLTFLFLGGLILLIVFVLFIFLPKESARMNIVKAVPSSIKP